MKRFLFPIRIWVARVALPRDVTVIAHHEARLLHDAAAGLQDYIMRSGHLRNGRQHRVWKRTLDQSRRIRAAATTILLRTV